MNYSARLSVGAAAAVSLIFSLSQPALSFDCGSSPYIIFFDAGDAYIDTAAMDTLENFRDTARSCLTRYVMIEGHTDTKESPRLAGERAEVVRSYLASHGIPVRDIHMKSMGSKILRIKTKNDVDERQNRRVEISIIPK